MVMAWGVGGLDRLGFAIGCRIVEIDAGVANLGSSTGTGWARFFSFLFFPSSSQFVVALLSSSHLLQPATFISRFSDLVVLGLKVVSGAGRVDL